MSKFAVQAFSETTASIASNRSSDRSVAICFGLVLAYLVVVALLVDVPPSWGDEVQFTDPAANLYMFGRFDTTAWPYQKAGEVFFGNAPLFSLLLAGWFKIVGFGLYQARLLPALFLAIGMGFSLAAVRRSGCLATARLPWLTMLFLVGAGLTVSTWNVRYDTLGFLVIAALLYGLASPDDRAGVWIKRTVLFLAALAGFHLVFVVVIIYALWAAHDRKRLGKAAADIGWMAAGTIAMIGYYAKTVGLGRFLFLTFFSTHTSFGQAARSVFDGGGKVIARKLHDFAELAVQDASFSIVLLACIVLFLLMRRAGSKIENGNPLRFFALATVGLPIVLWALGKYPIYYSWIGWSAACVLFFMLLERHGANCQAQAAIASAVIIMAAVGGLGGAVVTDIRAKGHGATSAALNAALDSFVSPNGLYYADDAAYFEVRPRARYVYTTGFAHNHFLPGFPSVAPVRVMVVKQADAISAGNLTGGRWRNVWQARTAQDDHSSPLSIWVRVD